MVISVHPQLAVRKGAWGNGLVWNGTDGCPGEVEGIRVPSTEVWLLGRCLQLLKDTAQWEELHPWWFRELEVVKVFLVQLAPALETSVVAAYVLAFECCWAWGRAGGGAPPLPLRATDAYMEVLRGVEVVAVDTEDVDVLEQYRDVWTAQLHPRAAAALLLALEMAAVYPLLVAALDKVGREEREMPTPLLAALQRIQAVVRSRVLEIPSAVAEDLDDFEVNTSLVPMVDYANHKVPGNARFDVDRSNGDVVLRLSPGGEAEVCIEYAPVEDAGAMFLTYGFVPPAAVYEIGLGAMWEACPGVPLHFPQLCRWLKIMPTVQFLSNGSVNTHHDYLAVVFAEGLEYNPHWAQAMGIDKDDAAAYEAYCGLVVVLTLASPAVMLHGAPQTTAWLVWNGLSAQQQEQCTAALTVALRQYCARRAERLRQLPAGHALATLRDYEAETLLAAAQHLAFDACPSAFQGRRKPRVNYQFLSQFPEVYAQVAGAGAGSSSDLEQQLSSDLAAIASVYACDM